MALVACPSCGEKGSIPNQLVGKRIKCNKCGKGFQSVPMTVEVPVLDTAPAAGPGARSASIEVDGLEASNWTAPAVSAGTDEFLHETDHPAEGFTASAHAPEHPDASHRHYKVLTQKDRFFEGKFDLGRLEEALNHYAAQGWVVRAMSTPHVTGFSGGPREEIVVLLER